MIAPPLIASDSPLLQPDAVRFITQADVITRRQALCQHLWNWPALPNHRDLLRRNDAFPTSEYAFGSAANLESIDELWIEMDYGLKAGAYFFHPIEPNGCLFIYHSGHSPSPSGEDFYYNAGAVGQPHYGLVIPTLIRCGFTVLSISMPVYGAYRNPVVNINGNDVTLTTHDQMFELLERPMRFFLEPVHVFLNIIGRGFRCISMMGLSGGGWTTTLCAAIDPRIQRSYPVAGSVPIWLRPPLDDLGDAEQVFEPFYSIANYTELYVMGSAGRGRRQFQFLNEHDPECFPGIRHTKWVPHVKEDLESLGEGRYDFWLDQTNMRHSVSKAMLERILLDHADLIDFGRLIKLVVA